MRNVKITVLDTIFNAELAEKYENIPLFIETI